MTTRLMAQLCQIGGAVERGLLTKEDTMKALRIGEAAAQGNVEAIEVQAAFETADGRPLSPEVEAGIGVKIQKILASTPEAPAKPPAFTNPLGAKQS